jgi:hypothetical protein
MLNENATFNVYDMDGSDEASDLFGTTNVLVSHMLATSCHEDQDEEFPFDCLNQFNLTRKNGNCVKGNEVPSPAAFKGADHCDVIQPNLHLAFKYDWQFVD